MEVVAALWETPEMVASVRMMRASVSSFVGALLGLRSGRS
jgi:hypothetical protein